MTLRRLVNLLGDGEGHEVVVSDGPGGTAFSVLGVYTTEVTGDEPLGHPMQDRPVGTKYLRIAVERRTT